MAIVTIVMTRPTPSTTFASLFLAVRQNRTAPTALCITAEPMQRHQLSSSLGRNYPAPLILSWGALISRRDGPCICQWAAPRMRSMTASSAMPHSPSVHQVAPASIHGRSWS